MDASTFRWVLIAIAAVLALVIYLFGLHQARLRNRDAIETFNHEEIDSAFVEDEQLRHEMNSLSTVLEEGEIEGSLDEIHIHPATEAQSPSLALDRLDEMRIDPYMGAQPAPIAEEDLFEDEIDAAAENESPLVEDQDEDELDLVAELEPEFAEESLDEDEIDSVAQVEPELTEESPEEDEIDPVVESEPSFVANLDEGQMDSAAKVEPVFAEDLNEDELDPAAEVEPDFEEESLDEDEPEDSVTQAEPPLTEDLDEDQTDPPEKVKKKGSTSPEPEIFVSPELTDKDDRLVSYHLRHEDFRLIVGEEAESAAHHAGLELSPDGLLEYYEEDELVFQIASLSAPGNFFGIEDLEFVTIGFNCFIDLDACTNPRAAYEAMLKKIDELVRVLNVMVYTPGSDLLSISDVTDIRDQLF